MTFSIFIGITVSLEPFCVCYADVQLEVAVIATTHGMIQWMKFSLSVT